MVLWATSSVFVSFLSYGALLLANGHTRWQGNPLSYFHWAQSHSVTTVALNRNNIINTINASWAKQQQLSYGGAYPGPWNSLFHLFPISQRAPVKEICCLHAAAWLTATITLDLGAYLLQPNCLRIGNFTSWDASYLCQLPSKDFLGKTIHWNLIGNLIQAGAG